ncbi:MAG: hydrolase, haloacid dehalogenase-like family [Myxococcaceae bacterium]|nr:hydrolase, haloacid dehalogenase-like family [Myxococcaceae bacterium]
MLEALILDLGNVLVFHDNALLFEKMAQAFHTTPASMKARIEKDVWERTNTGRLPGQALRLELQQALGGELSEEQFVELWNSHFQINVPMVKRVESLVGQFKLCLLSNTHDLHFEPLRPQLPVLEKFDALVLSYEEGLMKPAPALYRTALKRLQVAPERAAFFDDVQSYADGASAVGIHGRLFTDVETFDRQLAELLLLR